MPLTNISSDWMSNASSGLRVILFIYVGPLSCILVGVIISASLNKPTTSRTAVCMHMYMFICLLALFCGHLSWISNECIQIFKKVEHQMSTVICTSLKLDKIELLDCIQSWHEIQRL